MTQEAAPKARKRGRGADPELTRATLVTAAFDSLLEEGFRGTTARSIAGRANCNQAAIYYHFGGIEALLIAAVTASSVRRLERYQAALDDETDLHALLEHLRDLHDEDRESGHLAVLAELVGGITASPELRPGLDAASQPWLDFVETKITDAAAELPNGNLLPAADIADVIFSLVLGVELRNKIDGRDDRGDRLFRLAQLMTMALPRS